MRLLSRDVLPPDHRRGTLITPFTPAAPSALDALGQALAARGAPGSEPEWDEALRAAARRLAAEARSQDPARAERLLLELKRWWPALPAVRAVSDLGTRRALWDRVVRLCVEEFYGPVDPSAA